LVYSTALPFTPGSSIVYQELHDDHLCPSIAGGFQPPGSSLMQISGHHSVKSVAFSFDGDHIILGGTDQSIHIWDALVASELVPAMQGYRGEVWAVAFSPDGTHAASGGADETICIWDTISTDKPPLVLQGHKNEVMSVAFSSDGTQIVSGLHCLQSGLVRVWALCA
jgi:WD40 repeat protein